MLQPGFIHVAAVLGAVVRAAPSKAALPGAKKAKPFRALEVEPE
jgi:hypothetical protein